MQEGRLEAGCDEAGRGCLAGPVFAATVILPKRMILPGLDDSKKLSEKKRDELRKIIEENSMAWAVASCDENEIDAVNILNASIWAMQKAVKALKKKPEHLLIDGNRFKPFDMFAYTTVIQGDGIYQSIAAASILAKTHRDEYMKKLAREYPEYGFEKHKGYATAQHISAIKEFGYKDFHRKSFHLKQLQYHLF